MNIQPQNPSTEKQNELPPVETKSPTPKSSPRSSPRASPVPPRKESIHPSDSLMIIFNSKDRDSIISTLKQDSSPGVITKRRHNTESQESNKSFNIDGATSEYLREKKEIRSIDKSKKKSAWYNVLYPTYKSRSEDFKRIFKDVPDDERLVVDYSCALQKEILVQGRLYASQNFLCFYANIFGWETCVTLKWRDVSAITKEKTALVIPNAILICTKAEKFFLTSFTSRDKTFLMLFRIWQNALLDQPMSSQEMWQWVHQCYGDELGLTSDDDDYIPPGTDEDKLSVRLSGDSFSEEYSGGLGELCNQMEPTTGAEDDKKDTSSVDIPQTLELQTNGKPTQVVPEVNLPTDMSDSSDSDDKNKFMSDPKCNVAHEGRTMFNEVMPIHVDQLFTLLFTSSKFFLDFHASRKTTDLTQTAWTHNAENNTKSRVVNLTMPLMQTVGPKSAQVTENQIMQPCSKPGFLYSIDIEITNAGIPYADSFYVMAHYCLQRVSDTHSSLVVFAQIKYRKSVWGLVRGFIEKNVWVGMEDYFSTLAKALHLEGDEVLGPAVKRKSRRRRHGHSIIQPPEAEYVPIKRNDLVTSRDKRGRSIPTDFTTILIFGVLIILVVLNVMLYYKLWSLEEAPPYTLLDLHILKEPPSSHEEWIKLLQKQETLHTIEMQKWQRVLKTSIQLLKQIEDSLSELQHSIHPTYTNKIMSVIQNHKDTLDKVQEEL